MAWLAGSQAWLPGLQAWLDGPEGGEGWMDRWTDGQTDRQRQMDGRLYVGKISPFYRTLSPIEATAQKVAQRYHMVSGLAIFKWA